MVAPIEVDAVRRKPGKGLVLMGHQRTPTPPVAGLDPDRTLLLSLPETAIPGGAAGIALRRVLSAGVAVGAGDGRDAEVSSRRLADDPDLRGLREALTPRADDTLWDALAGVASQSGGELETARADLVRYKPQSRCVIRYTLRLRGVSPDAADVVVFAKLFTERESAVALDARLTRLRAEVGDAAGGWTTPASLGVVGDSALVLTAQAVRQRPRSVSRLLQPRWAGARPEAGVRIPTPLLSGAATGLARLHAIRDRTGLPPRTAEKDADAALRRADLLAAHVPELAAQARAAAGGIAKALAAHPGEPASFCHGGFKPAQLVAGGEDELAVVDWDGACVADPALDLGYFLAYLRPASLWRGSRLTRAWFDEAASVMCEAYDAEVSRLASGNGADPAGVRRRAAVYEAALLFKIACRRVNRLNAPRPVELGRILDEADSCLRRASGDRTR